MARAMTFPYFGLMSDYIEQMPNGQVGIGMNYPALAGQGLLQEDYTPQPQQPPAFQNAAAQPQRPPLGEAFQSMMMNPLFHLGIGLMANRDNAGAGLGMGLASYNQQLQYDLLNQARKKKLQEEEDLKKAQRKMAEALGIPIEAFQTDMADDLIKAMQGPDAEKRFNMAQGLRKEFNQLEPVQTYYERRAAYDLIQKALANEEGVFDYAAISAINKLLDPTSVVRQSEVQAISGAGTLKDTIQGMMQQAFKTGGAQLPSNVRSQVQRLADELYGISEREYNSFFDEYSGYANAAGLDPSKVFTRKGTSSYYVPNRKDEENKPPEGYSPYFEPEASVPTQGAPVASLSTGDPALDRHIQGLESQRGFIPGTISNIGRVESSFDPRALGTSGERGMFQFMPAMWDKFGGGADPFDPYAGATAAANFFDYLLKKYNGDYRLALAAYNAGEPMINRQRAKGVPYPNRQYWSKYDSLLSQFDPDEWTPVGRI